MSTMPSNAPHHPSLYLSYNERCCLPNTTALAAYLFRLIAIKQSNLCVSADVTSTTELLRLAEEVGDSICILKTHADIVHDFSTRTMNGLRSIARRKNFLIFEDRKFGDIGSTVQKQYTSGPLQIVRWAHIINAHIFPGPSIITALASAAADATTAYSTSVVTNISASPQPSYAGSDVDDHTGTERGSDGEEDEEGNEDDEEDGGRETSDSSDDDGDYMDAEEERRIGQNISPNADRWSRKQSVVSVSTTISTRTEQITNIQSALPPHTHGSPIARSSSNEERAAALDSLGPPPLARALLLLAEMSSAGNLFTPEYTAACAAHARANPDFVMGFIAQRSLNSAPGDNFVTMTPGVQIGAVGDGLGQQYNTPEKVVRDAGTDVIIVGRGIYAATDRRQKAEEYRLRAWRAYEERIRKIAR